MDLSDSYSYFNRDKSDHVLKNINQNEELIFEKLYLSYKQKILFSNKKLNILG